jgi:hypothetical protein
MCEILFESNKKIATGYKVVYKENDKYFSLFTGMEL